MYEKRIKIKIEENMGQIIAALDLGTSKSIAFVAEKEYSGKLSVLHTETLPSNQAIRRGRVYNSEGTSDIISKLIRKLNNNLSSPIEKIYVGIGGQSLRTQLFRTEKAVENETVSRQLLESLKEKAQQYRPELDENLGVISCEYYADGQLVSNPQGTVASNVEARFQLIVGNPCLKGNLEKILKEKEIVVASYFISPLATAEAALTSVEKERGCALVEWGEGVTYLSIYKNNALQYMATIPLGGLTITKDIRSLNVSETEAEALKIKYGSAISDLNNKEEVPVNEELNSPRKIELKDLNWIIEARVDEIVKNIWNQIRTSGYSQMLDAGIVITGGGALLRNLPQFIRNQIGKEVRLAHPTVWINQIETQSSPADSCVVGLAILGKENCVKETKSKEREKAGSLFGSIEQETIQVTKSEIIPKGPELVNPHPRRGLKDKFKDFFDKGANLFKEEDFENPNKPIREDSTDIQPEDKNSDNPANK